MAKLTKKTEKMFKTISLFSLNQNIFLLLVCKLLNFQLIIGFSFNSYSNIRLTALCRDRRFPRDFRACLDFGKAVQRSNR